MFVYLNICIIYNKKKMILRINAYAAQISDHSSDKEDWIRETTIDESRNTIYKLFRPAIDPFDCKIPKHLYWMYKGKSHNGKLHGKGRFVVNIPGGEIVYDGMWVEGIIHGKGHMKWYIEGEDYEGDWVKGKRHGHGVYTYRDPHIISWHFTYDGDWKDDYMDGKGTCTDSEGGVYVGEWVDGQKYGKGTYTPKNSVAHDEEWKHGVKQE